MTRRLHVITRHVSAQIAKCELTCIEREPISLERVVEQHAEYVRLFTQKSEKNALVRLSELPALDEFPDSMFVEDVAVIFEECVVLTRPGAVTRQGEVSHMQNDISALFDRDQSLCRPVLHISAPGTVDGGDVLVIGKHVFVGRSTRTNDAGFEQLSAHVAPFGYVCKQVVVHGCLHLKSAASMLTPSTALVNPAWIDKTIFTDQNIDTVDVDVAKEPHAANVLSYEAGANRVVVVPAAFPLLKATLDEFAARRNASGSEALRVVTIAVDEIAKAEGALTCCSLLMYTTTTTNQ